MATTAIEIPLRTVLRAALVTKVDAGWFHLRPGWDSSLDEMILLIPGEPDPRVAARYGYFRAEQNMQLIEECAEWTRRFAPEPDDDLLVGVFRFRMNVGAWPPQDWFLPPELAARFKVLKEKEERKLYRALGAERPHVSCRREGCRRGAITASLFCRSHHFEMLLHRPCPFDGNA